MTMQMAIDDLLRTSRYADVFIKVDGRIGFVSNATLVNNTWLLYVLHDVTRLAVGTLPVPVGGTVEVIRIDG